MRGKRVCKSTERATRESLNKQKNNPPVTKLSTKLKRGPKPKVSRSLKGGGLININVEKLTRIEQLKSSRKPSRGN